MTFLRLFQKSPKRECLPAGQYQLHCPTLIVPEPDSGHVLMVRYDARRKDSTEWYEVYVPLAMDAFAKRIE